MSDLSELVGISRHIDELKRQRLIMHAITDHEFAVGHLAGVDHFLAVFDGVGHRLFT